MAITVVLQVIRRPEQRITLEDGDTVESLLCSQGLHSNEYAVQVNGSLASGEAALHDDDIVTLGPKAVKVG